MPKKNFLPFIKPDENLSKIIGNETIQTQDMLKKLWIYIKKNNLKIAFADYKK
jgi:chromatin remodeling complex protein RSC6